MPRRSAKDLPFPKTLYVVLDPSGGLIPYESIDEIDEEQIVAVYDFGTSGQLTITHSFAGFPVKRRVNVAGSRS